MDHHGNRQPTPLSEPFISRWPQRLWTALFAIPVLLMCIAVACDVEQDRDGAPTAQPDTATPESTAVNQGRDSVPTAQPQDTATPEPTAVTLNRDGVPTAQPQDTATPETTPINQGRDSVPTSQPQDTATPEPTVVKPEPEPIAQSSEPQPAIDLTDKFREGYTPERAIINGSIFRLEVANDPSSRTQGLSGREFLAEDAGMLFVFRAEGIHSFWMKDVPFSLDLVYIAANGMIVDIQTMKAQPGVPDSDLTIYEPAARALLALEILGGKASELGLEVGMLVAFE